MADFLITAEALKPCCQQDDVLVVDCRFSLQDASEGETRYREAHIPGAYYLHLERDLSSPKGTHGGRHPLPAIASLTKLLGEMGIGPETLVVAYDDSRFGFAARLWWLLRYLGHDRVKLLDGGFRAWQAAAYSVSSELPSLPGGEFIARLRPELLADINEVKTVPHSMGSVLVDSREERRYLGYEEPIDPVAGHINGASNYPWQGVTDERGFFLDENQQRMRWGQVLAADEIVVYCGSGVTACVNLLSLASVGRGDAKLYAGSWSDWCSYL